MSVKPSKKSAHEKLQLSRLRPDNLEGLGDVDIDHLVLQLRHRTGWDLTQQVTSGTLSRTIEGASTVTFDISDDKRTLLRTSRITKGAFIEIDGLFFEFVGIKKSGDTLSLIFEDREISVLRTYKKKRLALRSQLTRAEFVLALLREVKEFKIPYVIPELHKVQPIEQSADVGTQGVVAGPPGFPPNAAGHPPTTGPHPEILAGRTGLGLEVKGEPIEPDQLRNAAAILSTGLNMGARRKVLVCSIMTAIQEATLHNLKGGDRDSVGLFQQRASWGSFRDRHDPVTAARLFFRRAIRIDKEDPALGYAPLCQAVQSSAFPDAYREWKHEAERIVWAYGLPGGDHETSAASANGSGTNDVVAAAGGGVQTNPYMFYRGVPPHQGQPHWKKEDSWTCIQRLAGEVQWRAFFVSGTFYFVDEDDLFKSRPLLRISEDSDGIDSIDYDYDSNKKTAEVTVSCQIKRWSAPPGSVVILYGMGPANGRWLVTTTERDIFGTQGTITLKKPLPQLPEPEQNDSKINTGWGNHTEDQQSVASEISTGLGPGVSYVNPFAHSRQLQGGRIDMGVDYHGVGPILVIGNAEIIGNGGGGWPGGNYLVYRLTDGPLEGRFIYVAEAIEPTVRAGQRVRAGAVIAHFGADAAPGRFPGIEIGWSTSTLNLTWAAKTTGYSEGEVTKAGKAFARLLKSLGAPVRDDPGTGPLFV